MCTLYPVNMLFILQAMAWHLCGLLYEVRYDMTYMVCTFQVVICDPKMLCTFQKLPGGLKMRLQIYDLYGVRFSQN